MFENTRLVLLLGKNGLFIVVVRARNELLAKNEISYSKITRLNCLRNFYMLFAFNNIIELGIG